MRYQLLDGWRGFFLIFMLIVHANETFKAAIGKLNHHYFGWVEDAQGFIFISGLVVGLVYGRQLDRKSFTAMRQAMWKRCGEIYKYHVILITVFLVAALVIGDVSRISGLAPYGAAPIEFTIASFALVAASRNMGILPMYIYFMLMAPWIVLAINRGYVAPLVVLSLSLWLFGHLGLSQLMGGSADAFMQSHGVDVQFGLFFNLFAWQIIFYIGLFCGYRVSQGRLDLEFLKQPQFEWAFYIALVAFFGLGLFDRAIFDFWISDDYSKTFTLGNSRKDFPAIYLFAFLIDLFIITWIFVAGPQSRVAPIRMLADFMHWLFSRRFLVFLGQHSLQVFAFHMLLVYVVEMLLLDRVLPPILANLYLVGCVLLLYIPAWMHSRYRSRKSAAALAAGPPSS